MRYGVETPKDESPGSLITFLENHHFATNNQFIFKDSTAYFRAVYNNEFRKNILSYLIFDNKGRMLVKDTTMCQWAGDRPIRLLRPDTTFQTTDRLKLDQISDKIIPFGIQLKTGPETINPDFTVVITWARFMGKYNYRLFDLEKPLMENRRAKIRLIWLNVDMQKEWQLKPGQRLKIK